MSALVVYTLRASVFLLFVLAGLSAVNGDWPAFFALLLGSFICAVVVALTAKGQP